ncbi:MAG TPA: hypothetical protein VFF73_25185 [Planctomycetota bacterium]|nr:hypothetical protein [Planctomycetota bacterium]
MGNLIQQCQYLLPVGALILYLELRIRSLAVRYMAKLDATLAGVRSIAAKTGAIVPTDEEATKQAEGEVTDLSPALAKGAQLLGDVVARKAAP